MVTHIVTIRVQLRPAVPDDLKIENTWVTPEGRKLIVEPKYGQEFFLKSKNTDQYEYQVIDSTTNWEVIRAYLGEGLVFVQDRLLPA
jgi:hypothetical protein